MGYILLVEAHPGMRNWARMHLATGGYEVGTADDARRALKLARTRPPDLVILATDLEAAAAYTLAATLRAEPRTAETPILFLAPADDAPAIAQASAMAPGSVLTKPLSRDALLSSVAVRLERAVPVSAPARAAAAEAIPSIGRPAVAGMLSMESKPVSMLVVTLRNLVSLGRSMRSRSLDALLRRFLVQARDAVAGEGGWVVRMDATGLHAVFENGPHDERNHASLALEAALQVVLASRHAKQWAETTLRERSTPSLSVGCGVHSGEVLVTRLPLDGQVVSSLAGVTVDIANRLNGRAKGLGWSVAVSETCALLAGPRFEFGRRASMTDTDHNLTLSILECVGFNPGGVMPEELPSMAEVREAVLANTMIAQLAGDVDPDMAERTIVVSRARRAEVHPELPERSIARRLGQGKYVTTYLATHTPTGREEAVKTVALAQSPPEFVDRYLETYRRIANLDRRDIVAIREIGRSKDVAYVATELLPSTTLSATVRKRISIGVALNLLGQVCRALEAFHGLGLFHGALRADHFLLRDARAVVLADFNASGRASAVLDATPDSGQKRAVVDSDHRAGVLADLRTTGLILLAMLSPEVSVMESALSGNVDSLPRAARMPMQLSSLQPLLNRLLVLEGSAPFASATEVLAELSAVENLWSRPVFPQD